MVDIVDVVDECEQTFGVAEAFARSRAFMAAYVGLMRAALPRSARDTLELLERFNRGKATPGDMEAARIRCWKMFEKADASETEKAAASALACGLFAELHGGIDLATLVSDFIRVANKVEDHSAEIDLLIPQFFGEAPSF